MTVLYTFQQKKMVIHQFAEMQIEETVSIQEQVEKQRDNSKIKKKTDAPRNFVNVDTLKWSKKKQNDHAK